MEKLELFGIETDRWCSVQRHIDVNCAEHLHFMMEIVYVTKGILKVGREDEVYELKEGEGLFFMPYEIHWYKTEEASNSVIIVFSPEFLEEVTAGISFKNVLFKVTPKVMDYVDEIVEKKGNTSVDIKAMLYPLLRDFLRNNELTPEREGHNEIIRRTLSYIDEHYKENISLKSVAKEIGCHYVYLSRNFSERTGFSFISYLNRFRVARSLQALKNSSLSITEVAYENGFGSLRSYNRSFGKCMSMTPTKYREKKTEFHIG